MKTTASIALVSEGFANASYEPTVFVPLPKPKLTWRAFGVPNDNRVVYLGHDPATGMYQFMAHSPDNEHGFGGVAWDILMEDGTRRKVKGPWSSNSESVCRVLKLHGVDIPLLECSFMFKGERYKTHGAIDLRMLHKILGDEDYRRLGYVNPNYNEGLRRRLDDAIA